jgi:hypothetical protein
VDRKELEMRIWGHSISTARKKGLISEEEAQFLLDEYLNEFDTKVQSGSVRPLLFPMKHKSPLGSR